MSTAYTYDFLGQVHHLSREEFDAIERSGRSCTIQQYALEPGQYLHRTGATIAAKVSAMHDRPGKTEPKVVSKPIIGRVAKARAERSDFRTIHWVTPVKVNDVTVIKAVCGMPRGAVHIGLHGTKFRGYTHNRMVCKACAEAYRVNHR